MQAATLVLPVARPVVETPEGQGVQLEAPDDAAKLPAPQASQKRSLLYVPGGQGVQEIGTPDNHIQLLSVALRTKEGVLKVPSEPAEPDEQDKKYLLVPNVGTDGDVRVLAKAARGGCESATISLAARLRE